jgi:uncharacterized protein (TIGR02246 family)
MRLRTTFKVVAPYMVALVLVVIVASLGLARPRLACGQEDRERSLSAGQPPGSPAPRASGADASAHSPTADERAIRAADDAFVREYNQGDSKALAARFTEDAEAIELDGARFHGRDRIERRLAETFAASPGVKIALEIAAIRFLTPDVAKEEGHAVVTPAKEAPLVRPYTVLYVKRAGRWLINSVREDAEVELGAHDHLKELEWMNGEWIDEGHDSVVRAQCRWSNDGNFLIRQFTVKRQGAPVMSVSQRIAWDPLARQMRSWEFDSEGGFGEGRWSRDGERWLVKHTAVRPEGTLVSAVNIMSRERPDLVRWTSTARVIGDESIPDGESYVLVRVPPPPGAPSKDQTPSTPTPNTKAGPQ